MGKRILFVFLATVLVISLAAFIGCGKEEPAPVTGWQWPEKFLISTMGPGNVDYAVNLGWSELLAKDTGMKVRLVVTDMTLRSLYLRNHSVDMSTGEFGSSTFQTAELGEAARDRGPLMETIVFPFGKGAKGFAVRGDSGIKTPHDLKPGVRAVYYTGAEAWFKNAILALLAWGDVDPSTVVWVPAGSMSAMSTLIQDGQGDVVLGYPSSPQWLEVEASPHGLDWITLDAVKDPQGAARYFAIDPSAAFGPLTTGCPSAIGKLSMITLPFLCVNDDADADLIYNIVKWRAENYDRYKDIHPYLMDSTVDNLMKLAELEFRPLHDGAVRYLEEIGRWTPAHEARRQQNIALIETYQEAFARCVADADDQGIVVNPTNKEWLAMWTSYKKDLPPYKLFLTFP